MRVTRERVPLVTTVNMQSYTGPSTAGSHFVPPLGTTPVCPSIRSTPTLCRALTAHALREEVSKLGTNLTSLKH